MCPEEAEGAGPNCKWTCCLLSCCCPQATLCPSLGSWSSQRPLWGQQAGQEPGAFGALLTGTPICTPSQTPVGWSLSETPITAEGVVGDLQGVWQGAVVQHDFGGEFLQQRGSMWGWASCCLAAVVWIPLSRPFPVSVHQEPGAGRSVPGTSTGLPGPQAHPPERQLWELLEAP